MDPIPPPVEPMALAKARRLLKYWNIITADGMNVRPIPEPMNNERQIYSINQTYLFDKAQIIESAFHQASNAIGNKYIDTTIINLILKRISSRG